MTIDRNDLPDVFAHLFSEDMFNIFKELDKCNDTPVDYEMKENYMYGDNAKLDEDEFDLYADNYCLVQFKEYGLYNMYGQSWETMIAIADFDIGTIRDEGVRSLSFNDGVLCDVSPDNILNITRLSEYEYMEACEMKACDGESVHLVI